LTLTRQSWRNRRDAGTERSRVEHYPCFDGLRAIAALTVIGVHTTFVSGLTTSHPGLGRYSSRLEIGVEVFFVISGFLLYRPFAAAHFGGKAAPPAPRFWLRRLKRIIPAYWAAFLVVTYVMKAPAPGTPRTWDAPLVYMGFAQIYLPHYVLGGLSQAWSLCTEMSFYLMVPLYAALLGRRRRDTAGQLRAELAGVAALTAISFAYRIPVLASHTALAHTMPNWLPGYLDQFALGMLLAVVCSWQAAAGRRPAWQSHAALPWVSWGLALAAFVAVANVGLPLTPVTPSGVGLSLVRQALYGAFGFFLVVPAVLGSQDRGLVRAALRWRPLALVGVVSYGVYLWHESWIHMYLVWTHAHLFDIPVLRFTGVVTTLAVAAASLSYVLVERPVLRTGRRSAGAGAAARAEGFATEPRSAGAPLIGAPS
jgi:peptidoglycan/LPS O-acetylase OafA/YrhL